MNKEDLINVEYNVGITAIISNPIANARKQFSFDVLDKCDALFKDLQDLITMKIGYPLPEKERWFDAI